MSEIDKERVDQIIAGAIILMIGVIGGAVNIAALVTIQRSPSFHNAFGLLCASHLLSDIGFLVPHVFWAAPAEILGWPSSTVVSIYGERIGQILVLFCSVSLYSQLQISVNRLVAILSPMSYSSLFSPIHTTYFVAVVWFLGLLRCSVNFIDGCGISFNIDSFTWNQSNTPCGHMVALYLEYVLGTIVCVIVIIMNVVIFIMIYRHTKKLSTVSGSCTKIQATLRRNNLNFFLQSCTKAAFFVAALIIYFFVSKLATTKWETFITRTLNWEVAHCVNGLVIFIFNDSFRSSLRSLLTCRRGPIHSQSTSGSKLSW